MQLLIQSQWGCRLLALALGMPQTNLEKRSARICRIDAMLALQYIEANTTPEMHAEQMSSNAVYQASVK
jgi:hypothetical protein